MFRMCGLQLLKPIGSFHLNKICFFKNQGNRARGRKGV